MTDSSIDYRWRLVEGATVRQRVAAQSVVSPLLHRFQSGYITVPPPLRTKSCYGRKRCGVGSEPRPTEDTDVPESNRFEALALLLMALISIAADLLH
jgi:hypothetical protein